MEQEKVSLSAAVVELGDGIRLILRWSRTCWLMDIKVQDFYILKDRRLIGFDWDQMRGAMRLALMTSRNHLVNFAARMTSAAASAAETLDKSAEGGEIAFSMKGKKIDDL